MIQNTNDSAQAVNPFGGEPALDPVPAGEPVEPIVWPRTSQFNGVDEFDDPDYEGMERRLVELKERMANDKEEWEELRTRLYDYVSTRGTHDFAGCTFSIGFRRQYEYSGKVAEAELDLKHLKEKEKATGVAGLLSEGAHLKVEWAKASNDGRSS
ncbi:MAG TPA: hypothetical protein VKA63_02670 [Candidatus Krumholzibacteria bacterium]|nr:hypothetical protein [Candidatus Krumholzibacteria bacterium]